MSGMRPLQDYRRKIAARFTPVVTVVTSPDVDVACAASGLTFVDILRPFADVRGIDVPIRTGAEHSYALREFQIRVHGIHETRQPSPEMADAHVARVMAPWAAATEDALGRTLARVPTNVPALITLAKDGIRPGGGGKGDDDDDGGEDGDEGCAPWFDAHHAGLERTLMFAEHEAVDHPVGMMFVVSSASPDPVGAFTALAEDPNSWPPLMRSEAANPNVPRYYVLLHDARARSGGGASGGEGAPAATPTPSKEELDAKVQHLRATFGATSVSPLVINSGPGATPPPDIWSEHGEVPVVTAAAAAAAAGAGPAPGAAAAAAVASGVRKGALFSDDDVAGHRTFVTDYVTRALLPLLETRVRALNANIAATRKGLKNQLKSFWGRSTGVKDKPEGDGGYTHASSESQIRVAADLAFMLKDYETAASHYRLLQAGGPVCSRHS